LNYLSQDGIVAGDKDVYTVFGSSKCRLPIKKWLKIGMTASLKNGT
jgi:hypothetical protein